MDSSESLNRIDHALHQLDLDMGGDECHGILTGLFCAQGEYPAQAWLDYMARDRDRDDLLLREALEEMGRLHQETARQLADSVLDFHPLVIQEQGSVEERIASLAEWCQGFLLGLSEGGLKEFDKLEGDSGEIIRDLVEIASAGGYELEGGEEDEESYTQLYEYVRTGVLLINEELHPTKAPPRADVTIH